MAQDEYCEKAYAGQWKDLGKFPDDLQWEALVDVLRGKVKVISLLQFMAHSLCHDPLFTNHVDIRFKRTAMKPLIWTISLE